jgi:hypothetical protein
MEGLMDKFEQLIEFVINDDEAKAKELFHDIVVEKSRQIYEDIMKQEEIEEAREEEDESIEEGEEEEDESIEEGALGGDQSDDLIDDVEAEEMGMSEEEESDAEFDDGAEEAGADLTHDIEGDHDEADIEDRVVDLEDKLDELMAEFEAMMGGESGDMPGEDEVSGDEFGDDMTDVEVADDELETEGMFNENVSLKAVAKPSNTEEASQKKSPVAANSGARGALAKPVHTGASEGGHHDSAAYKNTTKDLIGKVGNTPAQGTQKPTPATKPHLAQASGVNTKSVIK